MDILRKSLRIHLILDSGQYLEEGDLPGYLEEVPEDTLDSGQYLEEGDLPGYLEEVPEDTLDSGLQDIPAEVRLSHHIHLNIDFFNNDHKYKINM